MANFKQATIWLREKKKVRRPFWRENSYWVLGINESIKFRDGTTAHIHLNQIRANDWELYEEEDSDIKLKAKKIVDELAKPLENVISKVLEDLKNA